MLSRAKKTSNQFSLWLITNIDHMKVLSKHKNTRQNKASGHAQQINLFSLLLWFQPGGPLICGATSLIEAIIC